ncbi:hypothetical protein FQN60_007296 [Etheostoma spectabile]|uniref:Uncharacterized protein n=1 Tax=Etheostoma spectabile TaxID=54343 RepID=A0A5J5CDB5_9PERO|nr:hypothetical protein FQN60_007296 [Etheostoma spectabile]
MLPRVDTDDRGKPTVRVNAGGSHQVWSGHSITT